MIAHVPFARRIRSAPVGGGLCMDGWWVWCGSAARAADGRWHLFAARWPRALRFLPAYQSHSEIVRAVADRPEGPYAFQEVLLGDRGPGFWDGRMTHNPVIFRRGDRWLLFYIGTTFEGPKPTAQELRDGPNMWPWYRDIRIGVAWADDPAGPWHRPEAPLLLARPGMWDQHVVTNPSPHVAADGRLFLYYRSWLPDVGCRLGLAIYEDLDRDPVWRSDEPLFDWDGTSFEDPFVFGIDGHVEMIAKDLTGAATGELHSGAHLLSADGIRWELAPEPKAYTRELRWDDGTIRRLANLERPFLVFEDGRPAWLFAAMAEGGESIPGDFGRLERAWHGVVRLGP